MPYEHIQLIRDGRVVTLTLNRPEARNAMSPPWATRWRAPSRTSAPIRDIRVLVVTGEGRAFSGGGDLGMLARDAGIGEGGDAGMDGPPRDFYNRYLSIRELPDPTSPRSTATPSAPASASRSPATCASPSSTPRSG